MSKRRKELGRDKAYERILAGIIFGELPAGGSVDEKGLALRYGIGLASVREALSRLSLEGLIERISRRGTRIAALDLSGLHAVFEARVVIEERCAALAAERADAADIRAMKDAFAGYEAVIRNRDFRTLVRMDIAFHHALAAACEEPAARQDAHLPAQGRHAVLVFRLAASARRRGARRHRLASGDRCGDRAPRSGGGGRRHARGARALSRHGAQLHVRRHVEPARETCE